MYKSEAEASQIALKLRQQDSLPNDAYIPLFNQNDDAWIIYPKVFTLLFKVAKTGSYAGKDTCVHTHNDKGELVSSQTSIYRLVLDQVREFHGDEVFYNEYKNANIKWHNEKPHMFMAKISLAIVLRQAFPDVLIGLCEGQVSTVAYEEARCGLDFRVTAKPDMKVKADDFNAAHVVSVKKTPDTIKSAVEAVFGSGSGPKNV